MQKTQFSRAKLTKDWRRTVPCRRNIAELLSAIIFALFVAHVNAQTVEVLREFADIDGRGPRGALVEGLDGNFYGTAASGGDLSLNSGNGFGTIFKINRDGELTTLTNFTRTNGAFPLGGLTIGVDGRFYGVTRDGGAFGNGTVFSISAAGILMTLHSFDRTNGSSPQQALLRARDGNFYGTTVAGGDLTIDSQIAGPGGGVVFKMTTNGVSTTLALFNDDTGKAPYFLWGGAPLVEDKDGNLYGVTTTGGANGYGTIFKCTPSGSLTALHSFDDGVVSSLYRDSRDHPMCGLAQGADGKFYWAGAGSIFAIDATGVMTSAMMNGFDLDYTTFGRLIPAADGGFYGSAYGLWSTASGFGALPLIVYKVKADGAWRPVASSDGTDAAYSWVSTMTVTRNDEIYGTTVFGGDASFGNGAGSGTLFRITTNLPQLSIERSGHLIVISWPTAGTGGAILESAASVTAQIWDPVSTSPVLTADQQTVTLDTSNQIQFFRLRK